MAVLPRRRNEIGEPVEELIRRELEVELQPLFDAFDFANGWPWRWAPGTTNVGELTNPDRNGPAAATRPPVNVCPSDNSEPLVTNTFPDIGGRLVATGNYALVHGRYGPSGNVPSLPSGCGPGNLGFNNPLKVMNTGVFFYLRRFRPADVTDGLSKTMFAGEVIAAHMRNRDGSRLSRPRGTEPRVETRG